MRTRIRHHCDVPRTRPVRPAGLLAMALAVAIGAWPATPVHAAGTVPLIEKREERPAPAVWLVDYFGESGAAANTWPARHATQLREFYGAGGFLPRWTSDEGMTGRGTALLNALARVDEHGLSPDALGVPALQALAQRPEPAARMQLELGLSSAFLRLAGWLLGTEREEGAPRHPVFVLPVDSASPQELSRLLDTAEVPVVLAALAPANSQYQRLLAARQVYKAMADRRPEWPVVPQGDTIRAGRWDVRVSVVRRRMAAAGAAVDGTGDANRYDPKLREAVMRFQASQGLEADGNIGRATVNAMNAGPAERLAAIDATLERWRRMPRDLGARYVLVNIPAYRMAVMDGDRPALEMKVIVGMRARPTPTFSSRIGGVEINPTWSVPAKLAIEDIVPAIRRNPNYLEEHNIRVLASIDGRTREIHPGEIDWETQGRRLPFRFRQDPGAGNSLGKVKMVFPNDESIYLHDTPKRSLFGLTMRAQSSGCIRLEKPGEFADMLLRQGAGWDAEQIGAAFARSTTRAVPLRDGLPIHIAYLTAWVDDQGKVAFHDDIYDQDRRVLQMLQARRALPAPTAGDRVRTASAER
ncbi:MAG: L,D-transpeptidase family protein [Alphaproteobacteria bacterium]|nr:L,D-transpeptidase family protein [Alphaproteobacteria bacterium]